MYECIDQEVCGYRGSLDRVLDKAQQCLEYALPESNLIRVNLICYEVFDGVLKTTPEFRKVNDQLQSLRLIRSFLPCDDRGNIELPKTKKGELIQPEMIVYVPDPGLDEEGRACKVTDVELRNREWLVLLDTGDGWLPEDCYLTAAECDVAMSGK